MAKKKAKPQVVTGTRRIRKNANPKGTLERLIRQSQSHLKCWLVHWDPVKPNVRVPRRFACVLPSNWPCERVAPFLKHTYDLEALSFGEWVAFRKQGSSPWDVCQHECIDEVRNRNRLVLEVGGAPNLRAELVIIKGVTGERADPVVDFELVWFPISRDSDGNILRFGSRIIE